MIFFVIIKITKDDIASRSLCPLISFQAESGTDICILKSLGWVGDSDNQNEATATADIASLPPTVAAAVNLTEVAQCTSVLLQDAIQVGI